MILARREQHRITYTTVRDSATHKPEAPAKDAYVLRWRLRLVLYDHAR